MQNDMLQPRVADRHARQREYRVFAGTLCCLSKLTFSTSFLVFSAKLCSFSISFHRSEQLCVERIEGPWGAMPKVALNLFLFWWRKGGVVCLLRVP